MHTNKWIGFNYRFSKTEGVMNINFGAQESQFSFLVMAIA
jgi:hypothetical protein